MTSPPDVQNVPDAEPDRCATQHSTSAAPELTGPSGSAPLPPLPAWHDESKRRYGTGYDDADMRAYALATRADLASRLELCDKGVRERDVRVFQLEGQLAQRDAEIERLRGLVREYIDDFPLASLRRACSERWGLTLDEISNLEHSNNELTEQLAQRDEMGAQLESAHGMLQHELAENAIFRRRAEAAEKEIERLKAEKDNDYRRYCEEDEIWRRKTEAAEARVNELEQQNRNLAFNCQTYREAANEAKEGVHQLAEERDTLRTQVAELQEKLMVMCVAQIKELGAAIPVQLTDEQIKRLWWDRADGQGWDGIFSFARAIVVSALGPSPAPPAPAQTKEEV